MSEQGSGGGRDGAEAHSVYNTKIQPSEKRTFSETKSDQNQTLQK